MIEESFDFIERECCDELINDIIEQFCDCEDMLELDVILSQKSALRLDQNQELKPNVNTALANSNHKRVLNRVENLNFEEDILIFAMGTEDNNLSDTQDQDNNDLPFLGFLNAVEGTDRLNTLYQNPQEVINVDALLVRFRSSNYQIEELTLTDQRGERWFIRVTNPLRADNTVTFVFRSYNNNKSQWYLRNLRVSDFNTLVSQNQGSSLLRNTRSNLLDEISQDLFRQETNSMGQQIPKGFNTVTSVQSVLSVPSSVNSQLVSNQNEAGPSGTAGFQNQTARDLQTPQFTLEQLRYMNMLTPNVQVSNFLNNQQSQEVNVQQQFNVDATMTLRQTTDAAWVLKDITSNIVSGQLDRLTRPWFTSYPFIGLISGTVLVGSGWLAHVNRNQQHYRAGLRQGRTEAQNYADHYQERHRLRNLPSRLTDGNPVPPMEEINPSPRPFNFNDENIHFQNGRSEGYRNRVNEMEPYLTEDARKKLHRKLNSGRNSTTGANLLNVLAPALTAFLSLINVPIVRRREERANSEINQLNEQIQVLLVELINGVLQSDKFASKGAYTTSPNSQASLARLRGLLLRLIPLAANPTRNVGAILHLLSTWNTVLLGPGESSRALSNSERDAIQALETSLRINLKDFLLKKNDKNNTGKDPTKY